VVPAASTALIVLWSDLCVLAGAARRLFLMAAVGWGWWLMLHMLLCGGHVDDDVRVQRLSSVARKVGSVGTDIKLA
jgi:hypothetical protein